MRESNVPAPRYADPMQNRVERLFARELPPEEICRRLKITPQQLEPRLAQVKNDWIAFINTETRDAVMVRLLKMVRQSQWRYRKLMRQYKARETFAKLVGSEDKPIVVDGIRELEQMRHEHRWSVEILTKHFLAREDPKGKESTLGQQLLSSLKPSLQVHAEDEGYLQIASEPDADDDGEDEDE